MRITVSLFALVLFVSTYFIYSQSRVIQSTDASWALPTAVSIVRDGDLYLGEFKELIQAKKRYGIQRVRDEGRRKAVNLFPYGTSLLVLPVVYIVETFPETLPYILWNTREGLKTGVPPDIMEVRLRAERALASLIVSLSLVLLFLIGLEFLKPSESFALAFSFAFGTGMWSTASRGLWQHGPVILMVSLALYLLIRKEKYAGSSGLPLAFGYLIRPTTLLFWGLSALYLWVKERKALVLFVIFSILIGLLFVVINLDVYGKVTNVRYYKPGRLAYHPDFFQAFFANLFSPNRGVLFQSPFLLLSLFTLPLFKKKELVPLLLLSWGAISAHVIATSLFPNWWHGHSFGSRYMADILPLFFVLIALVFANFSSKSLKICFVPLVLFSVFVHYQGANNRMTYGWNTTPVNIDEAPERVWSLSDWQPLR